MPSNMYRTLLIGTFLGLLLLALLTAGLAWRSAEQSHYQINRTRLAHEVLQDFLRVKAETYALFKQHADAALTGSADLLDEAVAEGRLRATLDRIRRGIAAEVAFVENEDEQQAEVDELHGLAEIERQIDAVLDEFAQARVLIAAGRNEEASARLRRVLEESIDRNFRAAVEAAIADEQSEVEGVHAEADAALDAATTLAQLAAALSVVLVTLALLLLLRRLRQPLDRMVAAARAVAAGDFAHRIPVEGRDEFAEVAASFNAMVAELERSHGELEAAHAGLADAVAVRTAELQAANHALQRADASRKRFLADISHELRTPLTIIRGESEITLRGRDKPVEEYKTTLRRVLDQAAHTARLVDDLLFVARSESGEVRIELRAVAFDELLRTVCADAQTLGEAKEVRLDLQVDVAEAVVQGDPGRLRQLVLILLDNAVRFSKPHGAVTVSLSPGPRGVVLRVADEGVGIADDEQERVFERFYRGENAAERHGEGAGLGLPVAKAIVAAHQGEINLASQLGEGTTVTVMLPTVRKLRAVA